MDLEPFDLFLHRGLGRQERRNYDDRAQARWYAVDQGQSRQERRTEPDGDVAVDQRYGGIERRRQSNDGERSERPAGDPNVGEEDQRHREHERADDGNDREIARQPHRRVQADKPAFHRWAKFEFLLEGSPPGRYEIVPGIALALGHGTMFGRSLGRVAFGGGGGALGDFQLRITGAAGKLLDGAPIEISRGKIHLRESAVGSEDGIDQADFLEEFGPV